MREIIHIQIGHAGNAAGNEFWEAISEEHGIDPNGYRKGDRHQLDKVNAYFNQNRRRQYVPRAIAVDLDRVCAEDVKRSRYGSLFEKRNVLSCSEGTNNNWAKGFFGEGRMLAPSVLDSIRREAENCDCLQGFQIVHSIGGGTGSGLGSLILENLSDEYPNRYLSTYTIIPSPNIMDDRLQTYNAVNALKHLTDANVETYCLDNKSLGFLCEKAFAFPKAGYKNLNYLISTAMAAITTTSRLPGKFKESLMRKAINMIPFPRLHYFIPGVTPMVYKGSPRQLTVEELSSELFNPENSFLHPATDGKYLTANYILRGNMQDTKIKNSMNYMFRKNNHRYVDWLPNNKLTEVCPVRLRGLERAGAVVGNTTAVRALFARIAEFFDAMQKRKLYTHWFTDEGASMDELDAAGMSLRELIHEYEKCERALYDDVWHPPGVDWGGQL